MSLADLRPAQRAGSLTATRRDSRRWWILAALGVGQLMVVLDATVVNIALPSAQQALGFSTTDRQWVVTAYSLAFGGLLLVGGRLSDLFGCRRTLVVGMVGFGIASAAGGAATGFAMLVAARAVQGVFGAVLAPAALAQLTMTFDEPAERGKAFAIFGAIAGAGGALGLILGGALTQYLDWRWCLYVNVFLAVCGLLGVLVLLPATDRRRGVKVDVPGTVTAAGGLMSIVYGFSQAATHGWSDVATIVLLVAGALLLALFVAIESRVGQPLLPLRVLADRNRGGSDLVILFTGIAMFGMFLFLTYYIQQVLGFSPLMSGVAFLPMIGALMIGSTMAARLLPRIGPRWPVTAGMVCGALGLGVFAFLRTGSTYGPSIVPGLIGAGMGVGLVFGAGMNLATHGAGDDSGVASALPNIGQQVGGAIGTALLNTLATSTATSYIRSHGVSTAAFRAAAVRGDDVAFLVAAAVFAGGAVLSALVFRSGATEMEEGSAHAGML